MGGCGRGWLPTAEANGLLSATGVLLGLALGMCAVLSLPTIVGPFACSAAVAVVSFAWGIASLPVAALLVHCCSGLGFQGAHMELIMSAPMATFIAVLEAAGMNNEEGQGAAVASSARAVKGGEAEAQGAAAGDAGDDAVAIAAIEVTSVLD